MVRRLRRSGPTRALALGLVGVLSATAVLPSPVAPAGDGPASYTLAQAGIGRGLYLTSCSGCHDTDLSGLSAPPLKGESFAPWLERPTAELLRYIATQMPAFRPASLAPDAYAAILAFILQENGVPPGDNEIQPFSRGRQAPFVQ